MDTLDRLTLLRDGFGSALVAFYCALVVWVLPLSGVPVLALLTGPVGVLLVGACGCAPIVLGDLKQPAARVLAGGALLFVAGQLTSFGTLWMISSAHGVALGFSRGSLSWPDALLQLLPSLLWLVLPWGSFTAGLWAARGLRIGWAVLAAAVLVSVAPASANMLLLYAWLGLPLSA